MKTNKELVKEIIMGSIWLIDPFDSKINRAALLRVALLYGDGFNGTPRQMLVGLGSHSPINYHTFSLFFNSLERGGYQFVSQSTSNPRFIEKDPKQYYGRLILEPSSIEKLSQFLDMDDSKESVDWLLSNIDFRTSNNQQDLVNKYSELHSSRTEHPF